MGDAPPRERGAIAHARHAGGRPRVAVTRDETRFLADGGVSSRQRVELIVERASLERLWTQDGLEQLVLTHWCHLRRASLGLIRVLGSPRSPTVVALASPLVLMTLHDPSYELGPCRASASLRIGGGLLVAPRPRGHGRFTIAVERSSSPASGRATVTVACEVSDFHPLIGAWGHSNRVARALYRLTQLPLHELVTAGFLRSLRCRPGAWDSVCQPPAASRGCSAR